MTTSDEELIHQIDSADAQQLAQLILGSDANQERVLRTHLGDDRFRRMRALAARHGLTRRGTRAVQGNVVVIHGIMGAELTHRKENDDDLVWINLFRVAFGALSRLRLEPDGQTDVGPGTVRATGMMKRYYGELLLQLAVSWNVKAFFFDWRKRLDVAAAELNARIGEWFGDGAPVHIVAHSMGGLVARTFIANHQARWRQMWDQPGNGRRGGRLIMLGTPNQGSFAIPQVILGIEPLVRTLETVDTSHDIPELRRIFNSFPGSLQMLPSPFVYGSLEPLYQSATYGALDIKQPHLDAARANHQKLRAVVDRDRMIYVAGYNQPTYSYVDPTFPAMANIKAYAVTREGDGRVPHKLGLLDKVPAYFVEVDHGALSTDERVFALLPDLLERGSTLRAPTAMPPGTRKAPGAAEQEKLRVQLEARADADVAEVAALVAHKQSRAIATAAPPPIDDADRRAEELIVRGFLGGPPAPPATAITIGAPAIAARVAVAGAAAPAARAPVELTVRVVLGSIDAVDDLAGPPIDAVAVGHYLGVPPRAAEKALDDALSAAIDPRAANPGGEQGVLAQFAQRGIVRGGLGQPFFLPDPRARGLRNGPRLIAVAGLGEPGRLGVPELTVVVRELCWSLGRLGRRHLATVLIGAGTGNLSVADAMGAWMRGARRALTAVAPGAPSRLEALTFVEHDPAKVGSLLEALREQQALQRPLGVEITVEAPGAPEKRRWEAERKKACLRRCEDGAMGGAGDDEDGDRAPTVVTVTKEDDGYRFSALTESASIPERAITVDHALVMEVNGQLAAARDPAAQRRYGQFLHKLIVPDDMRAHLRSPAPLVLVVDANTARVHWEMLAEPDGQAAGTGVDPAGDDFLGTTRGLTRRLRTTFAPPPEPLPPQGRLLRVLVVANPAENARLPGAAREGLEVAELFERFNGEGTGNQIEVTRLFGPQEASRLNVLLALTERPFDVLHFAGHCAFDEQNPAASGWIFSNGARITARELTRIDRVPPFIFSNACESGITPERAAVRDLSAAASFAEEFFARGVSNFVCTAWEVDDEAARTFALRIYRELLEADGEGRYGTMAAALRKARLELFTPGGSSTWGAYQHYGSPAYRFFETPGGVVTPPAAERRKKRRRRSR